MSEEFKQKPTPKENLETQYESHEVQAWLYGEITTGELEDIDNKLITLAQLELDKMSLEQKAEMTLTPKEKFELYKLVKTNVVEARNFLVTKWEKVDKFAIVCFLPPTIMAATLYFPDFVKFLDSMHIGTTTPTPIERIVDKNIGK